MAIITTDNPFYEKLKNSSYRDLSDFMKRSGIPVSHETVRRAVHEGKKVSAPSLILISKYLGFTANEIRQHLIDSGDTEFSELIASEALTEWERDYLEVGKMIKEKCSDMINSVVDMISLVARNCNISDVNFNERLERIKKR